MLKFMLIKYFTLYISRQLIYFPSVPLSAEKISLNYVRFNLYKISGHKISLQGIHLFFKFTYKNNSPYLNVLLPHYFSTQSQPKLRHLAYRGTRFSFLCLQMSVACVFLHDVTTASIPKLSSHISPPGFCFRAGGYNL